MVAGEGAPLTVHRHMQGGRWRLSSGGSKMIGWLKAAAAGARGYGGGLSQLQQSSHEGSPWLTG